MMKFARRRLLQFAAAVVAAPTFPHAVFALDYPTRPLRWIVGFPPGGGSDTVTRIMAQWLSERLGQSIVVENKPGASTNVSIQVAVSSPPDGYTLVFIAGSATVNVTLFDSLPFNLLHDIAPVSGLIDFPLVPDAPAISETVPGYEANSCCDIGAPHGTSPEIIARLNREINAGLADPATRARLAAVGTTPIFHTPESFGAYIASEVVKWAKVIKASGARPE
jgi:tripartite-type tricarboxylate transporter receptor subunit TctC